jgi:hypothetical protein
MAHRRGTKRNKKAIHRGIAARVWPELSKQIDAQEKRREKNDRSIGGKTLLIGISGLSGSGKDKVGKYLKHKHYFKIKKFARPIKDMLLVLPGITEDHVDGHLKNEPMPIFGFQTTRWAMQSLGTDWGRNCMHKDMWLRVFVASVEDGLDNGHFAVTDIRFLNEVEMIQMGGGFIWTLRRETDQEMDHESESHILDLPYDVKINNFGTIPELYQEVEAALDLCRMKQ